MDFLVSVIVPVYNVEKYLRKCVDSILAQTYTNLEVILVDDGSSDTSPKICDAYAQQDDRVVVIHKKNEGLSCTRNAGIEAATGQYIMLTDSDDYISADMVEVFLNRVITDHSQMALCNHLHVDENGGEMKNKNRYLPIKDAVMTATETALVSYRYKGYYCVSSCVKLYEASLFEGVRYLKDKIHEDEFILHNLLFRCDLVSHVKKPMYYRLHRPGSIMSTRARLQKFDAIEARLDRMNFYLDNQLLRLYSKGFVDLLRKYAIYYVVIEKTPENCKKFSSIKSEITKIWKQIAREASFAAAFKYSVFCVCPILLNLVDLRVVKECVGNFKLTKKRG